MSNDEQDPRPNTSHESLDARGRNRRRLSKAALGAAPILMTLHASPLKAAGANCMPSGWVSGNTSRHDEAQDCGGYTPGYWSGSANKNPDHRVSDSFKTYEDWNIAVRDRVLFVDPAYGFPDAPKYFQPAETGDDGDEEDLTMLGAVAASVEVSGISESSNDRQIIRFGAAALLNAHHTRGYLLTPQMVRDIVTNTLHDGYYIANSGDRLESEQVVAFLKNTMDTPTWGP